MVTETGSDIKAKEEEKMERAAQNSKTKPQDRQSEGENEQALILINCLIEP